MANSTFCNDVESMVKELIRVRLAYDSIIKDATASGVNAIDLIPEEDLNEMEKTSYALTAEFKGKDEDYRDEAITLYNSITSLRYH